MLKVARLEFLGGYLSSLSTNYVGMRKDMGKRLPRLYYIKMKIENLKTMPVNNEEAHL